MRISIGYCRQNIVVYEIYYRTESKLKLKQEISRLNRDESEITFNIKKNIRLDDLHESV